MSFANINDIGTHVYIQVWYNPYTMPSFSPSRYKVATSSDLNLHDWILNSKNWLTLKIFFYMYINKVNDENMRNILI